MAILGQMPDRVPKGPFEFPPLESIWGRLGDLLVFSWGPWGPSWGDLGGLLGKFGRCEPQTSYMRKMYVFLREWDDFCSLGPSWRAS